MISSMRSSGAWTTARNRIGSCSSRSPSLTDCQGSTQLEIAGVPRDHPDSPTTLWMVLVPAPNTCGDTVEK